MQLSLKQRTLLTAGGLVALLLGTALSLDLYREYQDRSASLHKRGEFLADFLSEALARSLWTVNPTEIRNTLIIASNNPDFLGAVVRDETGEEITIGSYPFSTAEQLLFHRTIIYYPPADTPDSSQPSPQQLGNLTLLFSTQQLNQFLRDQLVSKGLFVAILVLLTLFLLYLGTLFLTRPLRKLIEAMQQFSQGEYQQEVYGLERNDEVADMAIALEVLRHNLLERDEIKQALEESNLHLEQRVVERTKALTQEVEERKQAEHRAKAADLAKSQFLANMSHEIRTPMNAVIGLTYLALQDTPSPRQQDYLEKIKNASHSLLDIINDILDLSKIEAGQLDIEEIPFNLNDLLDQLSDVTVSKAAEKRIEVIFDIDRQLPTQLIGDPSRLRQILVNLVSNAIKFTEQGEIIIRSWGHFSEGEGALHFAVEDSGIGMSKTQMERLFQTFSQADSSTSRRYGGTGLGLSISRQLTEMMGGAIEVESEPDKGSRFHFHIRTKQQNEPAAKPAQPLEQTTILIADDHKLARQQLEQMLTALGATVDLCSSGAEVIRQAQQRAAEGTPYPLVILDWNMPEQNGIEIAQQLHQDATLPTPEIILMSTTHCRQEALQQIPETLQESLEWLNKPVTPHHLLQAIQQSHTTKPHSTSTTPDPDLSGTRILLVEDNLLNQQVAREILWHANIEVVIANNGIEALKILEQDRNYSLVLMDLQMPEMDGFEATREIRKQLSSKSLPIIAMTANAMSTDRIQADEVGMNDFLFKPIDIEKLYHAIKQWRVPITSSTQSSSTHPSPSSNALSHYDWPKQLPGLDVEEGVARAVGNQQTYLRIIRSFVDQAPSFIQPVSDAMEAGNPTELQRAIHSIKGIAANISAHSLADLSSRLEQHIIASGNLDTHQRQTLEQELARVITSIEQLQQVHTPSPVLAEKASTTPLSEEELNQQLTELIQQLEDNSFDATDLFQQLEPTLATQLEQSIFERLSSAIQNLDFTVAHQLLTEHQQKNR